MPSPRRALVLLAFAAAPLGAQDAAERIRFSQAGFLPRAPKSAVVADTGATTFAVVDAARGDTVLRGPLSPPRAWAPSGETVRVATFDALARPGRYRLVVPGLGASRDFAVDPLALREAARAAVKAFYFQRASTELPARHAGRWARAAGHPDTVVLVHPSAAGPGRPAGAVVSAPGGWYDAGDYNKYVVNSGISTYELMLLAEQWPAYARRLTTNVPETANRLPDALDEALWNLRWMLRMQDPRDGGVYHKLTNAEFDPMEMPDRANGPARYVVQKSTAAALDLAATAAHASLVVRPYARELPGLADSLVRAATRAWSWARQHPDSVYDQEALDRLTSPAVHTGAYGDRQMEDEFRWAAAELYLATRADSFLAHALTVPSDVCDGRRDCRAFGVPGFASVATLGLWSLLDHRDRLPKGYDAAGLRRALTEEADSLVARRRRSPYGVAMTARDFVWGSNAVAANQGVLLVQAYRVTGDTAYLAGAVATLDYLLGRNPLGVSFETGVGARSPRHPHHRPSQADTVADPVPGLLVGGPNPGRQDRCPNYPSTLPALAWLDDVCSYASNEIAINWNAPFAYLLGAVDAIYSRR